MTPIIGGFSFTKHICRNLTIDVGQEELLYFFSPQNYSHAKCCHINLSTGLYTLSTVSKVIFPHNCVKNRHNILIYQNLPTCYPQIVHKYECSLLTIVKSHGKKYRSICRKILTNYDSSRL